MKIKNCLNSWKLKHCKKKIVWNFLKTNGQFEKAIWTLFVTIICGFHFDKTSRIYYEKYDGKYYVQWHLSALMNVCSY